MLFADEPTGALDALTGEQVLTEMVHVAREQGTAVVLVTHEAQVAAYADREIVPARRRRRPDRPRPGGRLDEGRARCSGSPSPVSRTDRLRTDFTAVSAALAALVLLAAAAVAAVPELGGSDDGSDAWNEQYAQRAAQASPACGPAWSFALLLLAVPVLSLAGQCIRFGSPARDRRLAAHAAGRRDAGPGRADRRPRRRRSPRLLGSIARHRRVSCCCGRCSTCRDARRPAAAAHRRAAVRARLRRCVLVLVPVLAALIGAFLLRRVIITPLGVVRRTRSTAARGSGPGVLIIAGLFALAAASGRSAEFLVASSATGSAATWRSSLVVAGGAAAR